MSEYEEENPDLPPNSNSKPPQEYGFSMNFDIDLESSWPLDHMSFVSNPMSPFPLSTYSDQPFSPLWAFSDVDDDKHVSIAASGFIPSGCHRFLFCYIYVLVCFSLVIELGLGVLFKDIILDLFDAQVIVT